MRAWYDEEDTQVSPNYNPFRKVSRKRKTGDEDGTESLYTSERGVCQDESEGRSSLEVHEHSHNTEDYRGPKHASTMPSASRTSVTEGGTDAGVDGTYFYGDTSRPTRS